MCAIVRNGLSFTSLLKKFYPVFEAQCVVEDRIPPDYVRQEFEDYLKGGRLEHGFLRVRCDSCLAAAPRSWAGYLVSSTGSSQCTLLPSMAITWAQRLKRVFNIDIEVCSKCGGAAKVIACIEDPAVIDKILTHLDKKTASVEPGTLPPSRAPPRVSLFD